MEVKINKKTDIKIPAEILSNDVLSLNDKLIYGLHYSYSLKKKHTHLTNIEIADIFCLNVNTVSKSHQTMYKLGYLEKVKKKEIIIVEAKLKELKVQQKTKPTKAEKDRRDIILPFEVYHTELKTGAKLLWGEYNTFRDTKDGYKATREYAAKRLNVDENSISNWTIELNDNDFFEEYDLKISSDGSQRVVRTKQYKRENN